MQKRILFKKIIVSFSLFLVFCSYVFSNSQSEVPKTVRIAYYENEIFQEGARPGVAKKGYAYEYYRKIAEYTGWKYEYVYGEFNELYTKFVNGEVDLIAGLAYKDERLSVMNFPQYSMGSTNYYLVKKSDRIDISSLPKSLTNAKIGVMKSYMTEILQNWIKKNNVNATIVIFETDKDLHENLLNNKVDAIITEGSGTYGYKGIEAFTVIGTNDYYLCVTKNRSDLLEELNNAQTQLNSDNPGFIPLLNSKYFSQSISSKALSRDELIWVAQHPVITIGYLNNYLPYSNTDRNGCVEGLIVDLFPQMMEKLGLESSLYPKYVAYNSSSELFEDLSKGVIDLAFPVGGGLYYLEEEEIYQSEPVLSTVVGLIYNKNLPQASNRRFAVNKNNKMQEFYIRTNFPGASIRYYDSIENCLDAILKKEVDCTTINGLRVNTILKRFKYKDLDYVFTDHSDVRAFGIKIGNGALLKLINHGLMVVDEQTVTSMVYEYLEDLYKPDFHDFVRNNIVFVTLIVLLIIFIVLFFMGREYYKKQKYLRKEILKNAELEKSKVAQGLQLEKINNLLEELRIAQEYNEKRIFDMLRFASSGDNPDVVLNNLLNYIGVNTRSDRVYIFEKNNSGLVDNTYEWCNKDVTPEIDNLQNIDYADLKPWYDEFAKSNNIEIYNLEEYKKVNETIYDILKPQNINTLVAGPILINGEIIGFMGVDNPPLEKIKDISYFLQLIDFIFAMMIRMRNASREIEKNALYDQLTGCKNRKGLLWAFDGKFNPEKPFAVISFDMNGLKQVNDGQGHEAGDKFICRIANSLIGIFGSENVYRMGGDEFVAVLPEISRDDYDIFINLCNVQIGTTASMGSVFVEKMDIPFRELLKQADFAMYKDKDKFYQDKRKRQL